MSEKPAVLVLGGTGCVGRNLVKLLVDSNKYSRIRVADKKPPMTAFLDAEFKAAFDNPVVEFKQVNLSNEVNAKKTFLVENNAYKFKYVVNLAAETRYGQDEAVYKQHALDLSVACAKEAAAHGVEKYIEVSTAQVYEASKKAMTETSRIKPWTKLAKFKAQAEEQVKKINGLNWIILRPATIYGKGDVNGLAPRILCAVTYTQIKEKMKLLWTADLRIDVVSAIDVARAIEHCWENVPVKSVFNLADKSELTQKKLGEIFHSLFGIDTSYWGSALSTVASLNLRSAAETANDTHLVPWGELLKSSGIPSSPLSPYIDAEMMGNTPMLVDGSAIEKTGFKYSRETLNADGISEFIKYWQDLKLFPQYKKH